MSFFKNYKNKYFGFIKYANGSTSYINLIHGMRVGFFYKSTNVPTIYIKNILPGFGFFIKYLNKNIEGISLNDNKVINENNLNLKLYYLFDIFRANLNQ